MLRETLRNMTHLAVGMGIAATVITLNEDQDIVLLSTLLLIGLVLSILLSQGIKIPLLQQAVNLMERKEAMPGKGTLTFMLGSYLSLIFFGRWIGFLSVVTLSFLDSFSTVFGIGFGRIKIHGQKTVEGTLAGFFAGWAALSVFVPPEVAGFAAVVAAVTELYAPFDDNVLIPIAAGLALWLTKTLF